MSEYKETEIGSIPADWDIKTIDDIKAEGKKSIISGPFGSNISSKYFVNKGVPVIRGNNLSLGLGTKFKDADFVYISEEKAKELNTWAEKDDLIFTAAGTIGQVGLLTGAERFSKYIISNKQLRVSLNRNMVDPLFAYYWFASPSMIDRIIQRDTGSTIPLINLSVLKSLSIPVPPLPEQQAISSILSSLDDKVDLLHRQNNTLEALAKTLFRQWFVEESEVEGREATKLGSCGAIICGKTPSKKEHSYFGGCVPFVKIPDMHGKTYVFDTADSLTEKGANSQSNKLLPPKSILVSCIATVGLVTMNAFECQTNQQINSIIPKHERCRYYLYLKLLAMKDDLLAMASGGTATDNLNTGDFSNIEIFMPDDEVLDKFHLQVSAHFDRIFANQSQIRTLTLLRDALLPKLMIGEIRVMANG